MSGWESLEKKIRKEKGLPYLEPKCGSDMQKEHTFVAVSEFMIDLFHQLYCLATDNSTVRPFITGESGVGKLLMARAFHDYSTRKRMPFVHVNCTSIPEDLIEAQIFGTVKGAYTGAVDRKGFVEAANGGSLYLDEVADLPMGTQTSLLTFLDEQTFRRVGSTETKKVNVRILSSTNKDIIHELAKDRFREDLYYRLMGYALHISPIRTRQEDIPHIMNALMDKDVGDLFTENQLSRIISLPWFGNVRQLDSALSSINVLQATGRKMEDILADLEHAQNSMIQQLNKVQISLLPEGRKVAQAFMAGTGYDTWYSRGVLPFHVSDTVLVGMGGICTAKKFNELIDAGQIKAVMVGVRNKRTAALLTLDKLELVTSSVEKREELAAEIRNSWYNEYIRRPHMIYGLPELESVPEIYLGRTAILNRLEELEVPSFGTQKAQFYVIAEEHIDKLVGWKYEGGQVMELENAQQLRESFRHKMIAYHEEVILGETPKQATLRPA